MRTGKRFFRETCRAVLALVILSAGGVPLFAIGDKSAAYLKMDMGARAVSLGGAYVAANPDVNTPWYNPAGPVLMTEGQMGVMYNRWISETSLSYAGYVQPSESGKSAFGAGVMYYNMGSIEKITNTGYSTGGSYSAYSAVGLLTYARRFGSKLALGGNFKYVTEHIDSVSASAMAVDLGMMYPMSDAWTLGLAIQNIGQGMAFGEGGQAAPLPMVIRAGARVRISGSLGMQTELESADNFVIKAGFEYVGGKPEGTQFIGRLGYKTLKPSEFSGLTGITFGLGVRRTAWTFDIGIVPMGSYGMTQWLTFTRRIGFAKEQKCRRTISSVGTVQQTDSFMPAYQLPAAVQDGGDDTQSEEASNTRVRRRLAAPQEEEETRVKERQVERDSRVRGSRY